MESVHKSLRSAPYDINTGTLTVIRSSSNSGDMCARPGQGGHVAVSLLLACNYFELAHS
jgi:hypothetical protein